LDCWTERSDRPRFVFGRDKSAFDLLFLVLHSSRSGKGRRVGEKNIAAVGFRIFEDI
jgi:hypothetical protein